jgi:hypothetical protein
VAERLEAITLELDSHVRALVQMLYPGATQIENCIATIMAWGNGEVSDKYPVSPARMLFEGTMKNTWPNSDGICTRGHWVRYLVSEARRIQGQRIIATGIESLDDYKHLISSGFVHYHVVCSSATYAKRPKRPGANDWLAAQFDKDVIAKLSAQRAGPRMKCIWSDTVAPPSSRLFTLDQWLAEIGTLTPEPAVNTGE